MATSLRSAVAVGHVLILIFGPLDLARRAGPECLVVGPIAYFVHPSVVPTSGAKLRRGSFSPALRTHDNSHQIGCVFSAQFSYYASAVNFDGPWRYFEFTCDRFVRAAGNDQAQYLSLARGEA